MRYRNLFKINSTIANKLKTLCIVIFSKQRQENFQRSKSFLSNEIDSNEIIIINCSLQNQIDAEEKTREPVQTTNCTETSLIVFIKSHIKQ